MVFAPPGIYLIVQFNWPANITKELAGKARALHDVLHGEHGWIRDTVAASGGLGSGPSSLWIFWLQNYAALDRLLHSDDPISQAYVAFFSEMVDVSESVREQVAFI
jgi:hypothetical protein